jgi:DNA-binding transcriptional LysR family regulator
VSQTVRELERKLGGRLADRTSRRVEVTAFGARVRDELANTYEQLTGALQRAEAINHEQSAVLHLGLFSDPGVSQIPRIVKAFEQAHPDCHVQAVEVPIDEPFGPLHRGEFDLISSWLPHGQGGVVVGPILSSEPRVLAVSSDHPLASWESVSIEDVASYRVMRFETMPTEFIRSGSQRRLRRDGGSRTSPSVNSRSMTADA